MYFTRLRAIKRFHYTAARKPLGYWNLDTTKNFLEELSVKLNLRTIDDWNIITQKQIIENGGNSLLKTYSLFDLKCLGCPEGKLKFKRKKPQKYRTKTYWNSKENVQIYIKKLEKKLNLKTIDDWNSLTIEQIKKTNGNSLLNYYSLYQIKCLGFPDGKLKFKQQKSNGFWNNNENIQNFVNELKEKLNLNSFDDWNNLTQNQVILHGGGSLLSNFSLYDIKCLGFPDGKMKFKKPVDCKPQGYWKNEENIHNYLKILKEKLNLNSFDDWNNLTQNQVILNGGGSLFNHFSLYDIKCFGFPDGKMKFNKSIDCKPLGYWRDDENILNFIKNLGVILNFNTPEDWNLLNQSHIILNGGSSLLTIKSLFELKCLACPEGISIFEKSKPKQYKTKGFWNNKDNIHEFLNNLKEKLNLNSLEDWNELTQKEIQDHGGSSLLCNYSLYDLKCLGFPEGKSIFLQQKPPSYWENDENIKNFLNDLKIKLNLNSNNDWQRVSRFQILSHGGSGLLSKFGSVDEILKHFLQNDSIVNSLNKKSSQRWLFLQIQKLFPHEEIVEDYFHSDISRDSGFSVQFDVFLIERKIAFEYHGKHHYEDIPTAFPSLEMYKNRDKEKEILCQKYGITLIVIPYWWDNNVNSLQQTINNKLNSI